MATINVGDLVRITDSGFNYSSYTELFRLLNFSNYESRINPYDNGDVLKVFAITTNPYDPSIIMYGLEPVSGGTQILMNQRGIEYVLPGNWHIKVTEENNEMLGNWRAAGSIDELEGYVLSEHLGSRGWWVLSKDSIPDHCRIEISTEQFKEYVLNESSFVLPEKWAIKITPDNVDMLIEWRGFGIRNYDVSYYMMCDIPEGYEASVTRGYVSSSLMSGYKVITTEQFIQYVLNQTPTNMPQETTPQAETIISNLEIETTDDIIVTTEKVVCITDKWNYVNLGESYEVIKRDEYYTYVKDSIGGESRYAHHYFEEWVDAETKAKRDSFKALFGDHSNSMFHNSSDDVQKLLAELYPKHYEYKGIKLKKDSIHESHWLFEGLGIRLIDETYTHLDRLHGSIQYDPSDYFMEVFSIQGYNYIKFKRR